MGNATQNKSAYICRACHKHFVREHSFLAHECTQIKREKQIKTPLGQSAWHFYMSWLRQKRKLVASAQIFTTSKYYTTFINFAEFVKRVNMPYPDKFIWLMVQKDYPPTLWTNDQIYGIFLSFVDNELDPMEQVKTSIHTILQFSDAYDIDPSKLFSIINTNELIQLIRLRKLSPWLLLFSKEFINMFSSMSQEQQSIIETLINPTAWKEKKDHHTHIIPEIKLYIAELGI